MPDSSAMAAQVYAAIKKRILERRYSPGERLSEARLVQELGLGRSPIRTALARLKNEGWIAVSPQSGTYIKSLSEKEIQDLVALRLLLETHVTQFAAANISEEQLRKLRRSFQMLFPPDRAKVNEDYFDEFNEFDSLFHLTIYRAAGNTLITDILLNLLDKVQWLKTASRTSPARIKSGFMELERILKALEARDANKAAALMCEHIGNAAQFAANVRSRQSPGAADAVPQRNAVVRAPAHSRRKARRA
jgi:GntR family transcriptional regulator, rspAB operon transcriptional repressor